MKVDLSCPIELWGFELPTEEKPACSFTFFNLGERPISSIQITVTCFDAKNEVLSRRVERPMALDATGRETFPVELPTEGMAVDSIDLIIDKAWFEDGSEWRRAQEARLAEYTPNELPPSRRQEQLRYIAGEDAVGFPSDQKNVWICVCGRVNAAEETACRRCLRQKQEVFARFSPSAVQEAIDQRERELEAKARQAREEASRQEFLRQERARRQKRRRRVRTTVACTALVIGAVSYLFVVLGLPELRYQTAVSAMASGDLANARTTFADLDQYRDALNLVDECDLRIAREYAASGNESKVDEAFAILDGLLDYPGAAEAAQEATYQKAVLLMARNEYQGASERLQAIKGYRDADALKNRAEYQLALQEMNQGQFDTARARFASLGLYLDAAAQAKECVYRPATTLMAEGKYDEALEKFAAIAGYSDANAKRQECLYQSALKALNEKDYETAAERFLQLGTYEDADEQAKRSVYFAAGESRDAGNYEVAERLYASIQDFEDAAEQAKFCAYTPAKALMDEGKYAEAAELFGRVPGYQDADELYVLCVRTPAQAAMQAGDYDAAIEMLERVAEAGGETENLLMEARYSRADKLEKDGDLENALSAFAALGDYTDAADRANAVRYAQAEAAFEAGQFAYASTLFEALGDYSDAGERVLQCAYELAMLVYDTGDLVKAREAFLAVEGYAPAQEKADECMYKMAAQLYADGDLEGAAEAFSLAGDYEDAAQRSMDCVYEQAQALMDAYKYKEAAELFDSIASYTDAQVKRDECYDKWLAIKGQIAYDLYNLGDYRATISMLSDLDVEALPRAYSILRTIYYESNLRIARSLIDEDRALEAYPYLLICNGYKSAPQLLDKNIYRILGTWETEMGVRYAFYFNGTCEIAGEQYYFNMLNPYGIFLGESPDELVRTLSYSSGTEKGITLREDASGKSIRLARVKEAEFEPTEDAAGIMSVEILPEEEAPDGDSEAGESEGEETSPEAEEAAGAAEEP